MGIAVKLNVGMVSMGVQVGVSAIITSGKMLVVVYRGFWATINKKNKQQHLTTIHKGKKVAVVVGSLISPIIALRKHNHTLLYQFDT